MLIKNGFLLAFGIAGLTIGTYANFAGIGTEKSI